MPELPEVETVVRTLAPHVVGATLLEARFLTARVSSADPRALAGLTVRALRRAGKFICFHFDTGVLSVHLRMTGKLLWGAVRGPYTRALLEFDRGTLAFDDVRQFGRIDWSDAGPRGVGPDPLELTPAQFTALLKGRRGALKPLLLNQRVVSGLGNIYVDEALYRARLHPLSPPSNLARLHRAIVDVLTEAIDAGGSSISDYVDAEGRSGGFQQRHQVYGRAGEACLRCGRAIERIVVAQRGTHFCPRCQR